MERPWTERSWFSSGLPWFWLVPPIPGFIWFPGWGNGWPRISGRPFSIDCCALSPVYFELTRTGEVLSRLTTDTTLLQTTVGTSLSIALRNLLLFLGGTVLLAVTSAKLTGLVFLVVPLVIVPILIFGRKVRRLSRASQDRVADVSAYAEEALGAIKAVQAHVHEEIDRERFTGHAESAFSVAVDRIKARALLTAIVIVLVFGAVSIILWIGGHDVVDGRITPGDLSAFVFYAIIVAGSVGALE